MPVIAISAAFFSGKCKTYLKVGRTDLEEELKEHWDVTFLNDVLVGLLTKFDRH